MTDSPPKIFKEEDFIEIGFDVLSYDHAEALKNKSNRKVASWYQDQEFKVFYGQLDTHGEPINITNYKDPVVDTHEFLIRVEKLEEELVECELDHETVLSSQLFITTTLACEMSASGLVKMFTLGVCHKCGKQLEARDE